MFKDRAVLSLFAGKGGDGIVSWRREKYVPKGGPAGGDGGDGGSIILRINPNLFSLEDLRNRRIIKAKNGQNGSSANKKGKKGEDYIIDLPRGTVVKDKNSGEVLYDLTKEKYEVCICKGGTGGYGNTHFKTSTDQAPKKSTKGTTGETKEIELELKLIADIGLIGFPNGGKSTLISKICKIAVKIAPYPFTTLSPNVGVLEFDDFSRVIIADIPGIIKGAHANKGLGISFLKHIERTKVLIYVIDISDEDPLLDFKTVQIELAKYDKDLLKKSFLVALNKIDLKETEKLTTFKKNYPFKKDTLFEISALTGDGLGRFVERMKQLAQISGKKY